MIGTHGKAAEQLLRTTEMLIGEQENVSFIDFVRENADTLYAKYNEKLPGLSTADGVLFLVDTGRQPVQRSKPHRNRAGPGRRRQQ